VLRAAGKGFGDRFTLEKKWINPGNNGSVWLGGSRLFATSFIVRVLIASTVALPLLSHLFSLITSPVPLAPRVVSLGPILFSSYSCALEASFPLFFGLLGDLLATEEKLCYRGNPHLSLLLCNIRPAAINCAISFLVTYRLFLFF
jgi:hypothetical protein